MTRARGRLTLSAAVKMNSSGEPAIPQKSPLAWLLDHYRADLPPAGAAATWPEPELRVELPQDLPFTGERITPLAKDLPPARS